MVGRNSRQEEKESEVPRKSNLFVRYICLQTACIIIYSTFRKDCNAELKLCASDDGTMLIVRNFCDKHNHPISRVGHTLVL